MEGSEIGAHTFGQAKAWGECWYGGGTKNCVCRDTLNSSAFRRVLVECRDHRSGSSAGQSQLQVSPQQAYLRAVVTQQRGAHALLLL